MALYSIEQKWLGLEKEAVRGTAIAPTKFYPITPDTELGYKLNHIEDELLRGNFEKYPAYAGTKEGTGTIGLNVNSTNIGELLNSLLGSVTSVQQEATTAYKHTFKRSSGISLPSYTLTIHRGISAKQYPLSVIKSMAFSFPVDNIVKSTITTLFKTETDYDTPPTPSFTDLKPFMFHNTIVKINDVQSGVVKDINITIDNGAVPIRVLNNSQDINDIISHSKLLISGSFTIFFENETARQNFLSNTSSKLEIIAEGDLIADPYKHKLDIILPQIHYTAYPYASVDGLLGASVSFNAYYNTTAQNSVQIELTNEVTSY